MQIIETKTFWFFCVNKTVFISMIRHRLQHKKMVPVTQQTSGYNGVPSTYKEKDSSINGECIVRTSIGIKCYHSGWMESECGNIVKEIKQLPGPGGFLSHWGNIEWKKRRCKIFGETINFLFSGDCVTYRQEYLWIFVCMQLTPIFAKVYSLKILLSKNCCL